MTKAGEIAGSQKGLFTDMSTFCGKMGKIMSGYTGDITRKTENYFCKNSEKSGFFDGCYLGKTM